MGFGKPAGFMPTIANVGSDTADSDASPITGLTGAYSLTANEFNPTVDAGFYKPASIGDYVFNDVNKDGVQNTGDTPIPGVVVTLYQNGSAIATTTTNGAGLYSFTGLTPGAANSYVVGFTPPAGFSVTNPLSGTDKTLDSDADLITGRSGSVTLTSGENNTSVDAGFYQPSAGLGDYVFEDKNLDGIQNGGDVPIPNVLVTLYLNGSAVATTLTDGAGLYSFTGLTPGTANNYVVGFAKPAGFGPTLSNVGSDTADSDADLVTGKTQSVTLAPGEFNPTLDAGFFRTASIGDYVFIDIDKSGTQTPGDKPLQGVIITLYQNGSAVATTVSDVNGAYSFTGLTPGTSNSYSVGFAKPSGFNTTTASVGGNPTLDSDPDPITGLTKSVTLSNGESNTSIDAGYTPQSASLGDYVFEDKNANGTQDAGDVPIPNVLVTLYSNGTVVATTQTNGSGLYSFTGLTPGKPYYVGFGKPAGFTPTVANLGDDTKDSDADITTGLSQTVTLADMEYNPTIDAGFYRPASLGDYVFVDKNRDGVQNTGDTPLPGVLVTLYLNGSAVATTTTNGSGAYSFTGLMPGTTNVYQVGFTKPAGYDATTALVGTDRTLDSDADPITGRSQSLTLSSGESNTSVDAGYLPQLGTIGDFVWYDYNSDGQQAPVGEPGVPGLLVTLFQNGSAIATTATDGNGKYLFDGLPSGQYTVKFTAPAGSVFTTKNRPGVPVDQDSDAGADGMSDLITLDVTQPLSSTARVNLTIDAGIVPYGSIGNYVWRDNNGNGLQDDGPTGIPNVKVELFDAMNLTSPLDATVTDGNGYYLFTQLIAGNYKVKFTLPTGEVFTLQTQGGDRGIDSNPGADGFSDVIPISTSLALGNVGRDNLTIDAGVKAKCATPIMLMASVANSSICVGDMTSVSATASGATVIRWYLAAIGNTVAFTSTNGQSVPVEVTTTTTYYVEAETEDGCKSERKPVTIIVNARPNTPSCIKEVNICQDAFYDLTQVKLNNVPLPGSTLEWHTGKSETSPLVTNLTAVSAGEYFLFEKSKFGCYSYPTVLTVNQIDCRCQNLAVVSTTLTSGSACEGGPITLIASIGGSATGVTWMTSTSTSTGTLTGANSLTAYYTPSAADIAAGTVQFTVMTNDPDGSGYCVPAKSSVVVAISPRPDAPLGAACEDEILCKGGSTKLFGFTASNGKINWYNKATGLLIGTSMNGKPLTVTPMASTTYLAEAVSAAGCTSLTKVEVVVTVKATCLADLAVVKTVLTAGPYKLNDIVSFGILAKNNGPVTAKSVTVSEVLPATLEFVSATPAAEFNAGTGVWTVGTLTSGSDRNLIIQARVKGTGTLANSAVISSPDDDPSKPENNTSTVTISVDQCAVNPPTIACAVTALCGQDESTVLTARDCDGTIKWSNGMTGNRISVTPGQTTVYSASCVIGACTSGSSNTIAVSVTNAPTPTILASADKLCVGGVVSLTATGCENGTVYWSDSMVGSVVSLTITGETLITAQCRVNNCYGKAAEKLIKVGNDLPKPTVVCSTTEVCPGETVTLTVQNCTGTPRWSTGETTTSITVTPTLGNSSYSVYCSNGANCNSPRSNDYTIRVIPNVIPTVTASATSICVGGAVSLTASGCEGTVKWSNNMTGNVISVTLNASESFYATCRVRDCVSDPSKSVAITVGKPQAPTIRAIPNTAICAGESVTLTVAEGCDNGTVKWTNTDLTGRTIVVMPGANTDYTATCVADGNCISGASNVVKVIVKTAGTAPTIMASSTAVCNGASVTLTASGCTGTVMWSNNMTGASIVVQPTAEMNSFYAVCKQADKCGSPQSRTIKINLSTPPAPTVVCSTSVICPGESVDLTIQNCAGSPMWSTGAADNGKTTITVSPSVNTSYSVVCKDATGCTSAPSQLYTITVVPLKPLVISASKTEITPGESVTLTAEGCPTGGVVTWSNNQTGSMIVIAPTAAVSYYTATCRYRSCTTDPSLTITIKQKGPDNCTAKAGTLVTSTSAVCASSLTTVTLSATDNGGRVVPAGYSVVYVLTKGSELVIQQTSNTPSFSVPASAAGIYTIHTLVYDPKTLDLSVVKPGVTTGVDVLNLIQANKLCADLDVAGARTKVIFTAPPVIKGPNQSVQCYGTVVSFTATGCENGNVAWSNGTTGNLLSLTVVQDAWFYATCTVDGCTSYRSDMIDTYLARPAVPTVACNKPSVCAGDEATLTAVGCEGGNYVWSTGATGNTLVVTPQLSTTYAVKCVIGKCESAFSQICSLTVGAPATPAVTVNGETGTISTCYGAPVTLTAKGCPAGSYAVWSNNMVGSSITVTPALSATYSAQCCTSNNCKSQRSNVITLTVQPKVPQPKTTDLTNACPFKSVNLANGVGAVATTGGTFEYYTTSTLEPASKLANTNVTVSGTYYVVEKTTTGCYSLPSTIQVNITNCGDQLPCGDNPVTANAGKDDQICAAKSYKLAGVISGTNATAQWKTSGTGTFDNAFSPTAMYVPSLTDVQAGQVTLTLSVRSNNTTCPGQTDAMVLTINGPKTQPTVRIVGATQLCAGETVKLEAPAGFTYLWSNKATTQSIVVDKSGSYSVQVFDQGLCSSVPSEAVSVSVAAPVPSPLVVNLRNACPATTVSLSTALAGITPKAGSTYEYRISEDPASGSPMTSGVGEGTYYIFERTASQCLSLPGKVIVKITDCANNTQTADIRLAKTVSSTAVRMGGMVSYTLTVTNLGPNDATNVDVRDVLPAGLELVPGTAPLAFTITNGAILKRFESLSANQSASVVIDTRLTKKGDVVNMASITYSDVNDPNAGNNTSSVTVSDNSPARAGIIGLAKEVVGTPVMISDKNFVATYRFSVTNYGDDALTSVGITDNLDAAFGAGNVLTTEVNTDAANDLDLNPAFTGSGANTQLLASTSKLAPGETATVTLSLTALKQNDAISNSATATAMNATTSVSDESVSGANADPDGDFDPTNNTGATTFQLDPVTQENRQLGVSLNVLSSEKQPDGSYNVTYQIFAKNFGTTTLTNVSLVDTLSNAFPAPVSFSLVGKPTLSAGSSLVLSDDFKGTNDSPYFLFSGISSLTAGQQDVITFTVNVQPGANTGPFYSTVYGSGRPQSTTLTVRDRSNPGSTIFPAIDQPTGVRFDLPAGLIGMAKEVGDPVLVDQAKKIYDIPYIIKVCNLGSVDLKRIQVVDDLSKTFGNGASVQSVTVTADEGLKVNTGYTGLGLLTNMLDTTASSLPVKAVKYIRLVARVNMSAATSLTFTNVAVGSGMSGTATVSDISNTGSNVDPDNDLDPRNNNDGTQVRLNSLPGASHIGVALSVRDTARQSNGSYNVTYRVVVKNYGVVAMRNVSLTDTLSKVFNAQVGAGFSILGTPIASKGSKLKLNPGFNGSTSPFFVLGDSTSQLGVGATDTLLIRVNVTTTGQTGLFFNTVYATATLVSTGARVDPDILRDVSTNGLNPDLNGNNNPTDPNESEATPLNLPLSDQAVFIPEGFSPNGDGINDLFVIRGVQAQTVALEVFNRWGHRVYANTDYKNDWDGKSNTGVQVGNATSDGLPDGTYYYVVKLSDGREFVRFMTINR
ncbi:SdrD B-like domain-containing protein [Fibrella aquatilis]|uniref:SdrD B-like domain-containing protein n=1 Tax=Fibrella aquatilis TaxID=2817059 RepID=UPI00286DC5F6|nr:SdrD B-like domain-containing protein [Fibrella aquatilis]